MRASRRAGRACRSGPSRAGRRSTSSRTTPRPVSRRAPSHGSDPGQLLAPLLDLPGVEAEWLSSYPALALAADHPLAALAAEISGQNAGCRRCASAPRRAFPAAAVPAIVCGPGDIARAHKPEEYLTEAELDRGARDGAGAWPAPLLTAAYPAAARRSPKRGNCCTRARSGQTCRPACPSLDPDRMLEQRIPMTPAISARGRRARDQHRRLSRRSISMAHCACRARRAGRTAPRTGQLTLSVSQGFVALQGDEVVGTAFCSLFGEVAAINMIIVDARMRGWGLGRRLMEAVVGHRRPARECGSWPRPRGCRFMKSWASGRRARLSQHQGIALPDRARGSGAAWVRCRRSGRAVPPWTSPPAAWTARRLIARILKTASCCAAERGFALLRAVRARQVLGPVVAQDVGDRPGADRRGGATRSAGQFLRIDMPRMPRWPPFAESLGPRPCGGGIAMKQRGPRPRRHRITQTFALASQALG